MAEKEALDLIGAKTFAVMLGTSQQNVTKSGKRALEPGYRGDFLRPDANFEGRPLWRRDRAEKYARQQKEGDLDGQTKME